MFATAIRVQRLTRYFGARPVVHDLDMQIPEGQVTALLGLNGAGKSTTIRIIMGLLRPTRGMCEVLGHDSQSLTPDIRMRIGYLVEGHFLYSGMRVHECAKFQRAGYSRLNDSLFDQIVDDFGITQSTYVGHLSRGQRAGVALALALAPDPELLVLDDPALGLDPVSRHALNETLIDLAADGKRTVLLSSHLLDDVERVADRVMVMIDGRLKVDTTIDDFRQRVSGFVVECESVEPTRVSAIAGLITARRLGNRLHVAVADADDETVAALQRLGGTSVERIDMPFSDSVLAYLSRRRYGTSFVTRKPVTQQ